MGDDGCRGLFLGEGSLDSDFEVVDEDEKYGSRLGMKFDGRDIEGSALDNRRKASAPPEDVRRCRVLPSTPDKTGRDAGEFEFECVITICLGPVLHGDGTRSVE